MAEELQSFQHGSKAAAAGVSIERLGEGFQINVGGVHGAEELAPGIGADLASCDGDGADALFPASVGNVDGIFQENDRIVVGEGDARATELPGGSGYGLGGGGVCEGVDFAGLADVPVLTEAAGEVTSRCAEGQDRSAREEVIQRLLFYGVDAEAAGTAVGGEHHLIAGASMDEAQAALAIA